MNPIDDESTGAIERDEHNPDAHAKRIIPRYLNPDTGVWSNVIPNLVPGVDYDYLDVQQTDSITETYVFKSGGSGGNTIRTIVIVYTSSSKSDLDDLSWS